MTKSFHRSLGVSLVSFIALLGLSASQASTHTLASTIAFSSTPDGNLDAVERESLGAVELAGNGYGSKMAFTRLSESQDQNEIVVAEIYVMNPDGTGQRRVTNNLKADLAPVWSPTSSKTLAYHSATATSCCTITLSDLDGHETALTAGQFPTWSPDGSKLLFHNAADVWVINADGTGLANLTNHPAADLRADWSPDGARIAFQSNREGNVELFIMNADGSGVARLTNHPAADQAPAWSPDGKQIAFQSNRNDPNFDIFVINVDGTGAMRLTNSPGRDLDPDWSPNGKKIGFDSDRDNIAAQIRQIFVMNADGSDQMPITFLPSENAHVSWAAGRLKD
jgi:Tol biopolymer transport system component